jgi:N-acetylmuramoyl-L-alanine amidase
MSESKPNSKTWLADSIKMLVGLVLVAGIAATIFVLFTPNSFLSVNFSHILAEAVTYSEATPTPKWPTPTPRPLPKIGIVAGHWGRDNDPGAVCPDGLTELQVNQDIAARVQQQLIDEGFDVDLLKEFDPKLSGYRALALVSIHADSCQYINDEATGFKVAASADNNRPESTERLVACLKNRYAKITGLQQHNSITPDMSSYHTFSELDPNTPAAIIETGFLNLDRQILTQQPDLIAEGITQGILCYIYNQSIP